MVSWCDVIVWFKGCIMSHNVAKLVHTNWIRLCNVKQKGIGTKRKYKIFEE